jgi:Metallo-beta-lactamase superfamily
MATEIISLANTIRERFPKARFVTAPDVIAVMRQQASPPVLESFWKSRSPGQIDSTLVIADELAGKTELEGEKLVSVPLGYTNTDNTTCPHVPSIGLVVAGDAVYNDVHVFLGESNAHSRKEWLAALDTIESLKPNAVVAGHKRPGAADTPNMVAETRQYIQDFDRITSETQSAEDLYNRMLALYPDRLNPGALWSSARGVKH